MRPAGLIIVSRRLFLRNGGTAVLPGAYQFSASFHLQRYAVDIHLIHDRVRTAERNAHFQ